MWRVHTSLLVILALGVSPLLASEQQKSKVLSYCPSFTATTLSSENKVPVPAKRNSVKQTSAGPMLLDGVIEVSADITTNQIWTAGNIYYITADISVQALLVIEPGTTVEFAYDTSMSVNNGGVLISCGTPDSPIIYTSDSATPDFGDYYCPIYIEETASHSTKVTYSYIEYAYVGIFVINNRLDSPIENNYFYYNSYGIVETGTALTDIQNNLLYYSDNAGMDVNMASDTGAGDASSSILIANNTCDSYQSVGILVRGVANPDEAGQPVLSNNIVSQSYYYGIALVNGYMYYTLANTGYYGNPTGPTGGNTYDTYDETDPVYETTMPYVNGTGTMPDFYLNSNSTFVNASDDYIEQTRLIGKTTDTNSFPDSNKADLGFHYPNWHFSSVGEGNSLPMDLNADLIVNFEDFAVLAAGWQITYDIGDLNTMADEWLKTASTNPPIAVTLSSAPNLVSGDLLVEITDLSDNLSYCLYLDGQRLGNFVGSDMEIPTYELRNGIHEIKVVAATLDDNVVAGSPIQITVQNRLYCLTVSEAYKFNESYRFAGFYEPDGGGAINLQIKDLDENVIWSNSSSGDFSFVVVAGVLSSPYNQLAIQETSGLRANGSLAASNWPAEWITDIVRGFDVTNDPNAVNAQSLLVGVKERWTSDRRGVWKEYLTACRERNLGPTICLFYGQATRENIQRAFRRPGMKSIFIITDGNREIGMFSKIHRTFFEAYDGLYFSYLGRNWSGNPGNYEALPPRYENGYSVADSIMYFQSQNRLYVMIDACKNGTSVMPPETYEVCGSNPQDNQYTEQEYEKTADMAHAFDIYNDITPRFYMGWRKEAFGSNPLLRYNSFLQRIWYQCAHYEKLDYAISDAATYESGNCVVLQNFSYVGNTDTTFGQ